MLFIQSRNLQKKNNKDVFNKRQVNINELTNINRVGLMIKI